MIILDTNVVSEPMKSSGNPAIQDWLDQQVAETLYLTATSLFELLIGIEILPDGQRKKGLSEAVSQLVITLFGSRILAFDQRAAMTYATVVGRARASGCSISMADGQIAAIATAHRYTVATRDTAPFVAAHVPVINPWHLSEESH